MSLRGAPGLILLFAVACSPAPTAAPDADNADAAVSEVLGDASEVLGDASEVLGDASEVLSDATEVLSDATEVLSDAAEVTPTTDAVGAADGAADVQPDSQTDVAYPTSCPPAVLPPWTGATDTAAFWPSALCAAPGWVDPPSPVTPVFTDIGVGAWSAIGPADPCLLWTDFNGDGKEDLALVLLPTTAIGPRQLLVLLDAAGAATPVLTQLPTLGKIHDCVAGDLDGDDLPEIALGAELNGVVLHNAGGGTFADATAAMQAGAMQAVQMGAIALFDPDHDGDLDLYLARLIPGVGVQNIGSAQVADAPYLQVCASPSLPTVPLFDAACALVKAGTADAYSCCTVQLASGPDLVLRNDGGKFSTTTAGWALNDAGNTLALTVADLDGDGWQDIFVGNDFGAHGFYWNTGGSPFQHLTSAIGMRPYGHVMGSAWSDFDGDNRNDLLISEAGPMTYYRGLADGTFANEGQKRGLWAATQDSLGWAIVAADFDQDGWLDAAEMRSVVGAQGAFWQALTTGKDPVLVAGSHLLLHNAGAQFQPVELPWPTGGKQVVEAAAAIAGDVDGDGDLDLVTTTPPGIVRVYRNDTPQLGHWLRVRVGGQAEGAHVQIWAQGHAQERVRLTSAGTGSKASTVLHFGLGSVTQIERVRVTWPSGLQVELAKVAADQLLTVLPPTP